MNDTATKDDLAQFEQRSDERFGKVENRIDTRFADFDGRIDKRFADFEDRIDKRFDELLTTMSQFAQDVDVRFSRVENELAAVKHDVVELKVSHNRLLNTIDGFIGRIDEYETEMVARDRQMERLLAWARKVSEKTGIPLENL